MRSRKQTPAGGVQTEKQQRYARLIAQVLATRRRADWSGSTAAQARGGSTGGRSSIPPGRGRHLGKRCLPSRDSSPVPEIRRRSEIDAIRRDLNAAADPFD